MQPTPLENYETMHGSTNGRRGGNRHDPQSVRLIVHKGRNAGRTPGRGVPHGSSIVVTTSSGGLNTPASNLIRAHVSPFNLLF